MLLLTLILIVASNAQVKLPEAVFKHEIPAAGMLSPHSAPPPTLLIVGKPHAVPPTSTPSHEQQYNPDLHQYYYEYAPPSPVSIFLATLLALALVIAMMGCIISTMKQAEPESHPGCCCARKRRQIVPTTAPSSTSYRPMPIAHTRPVPLARLSSVRRGTEHGGGRRVYIMSMHELNDVEPLPPYTEPHGGSGNNAEDVHSGLNSAACKG
ncbi:hypothetical protein SeMB42_g01440 [Synchytrium endobioticum]|uniref:Uncharacterized protein n=1 Tax=Synchytrium endobioticum TaxID=286115 RepID=A0A507DL26_9FUNG|nr:hypothetical protein SeLEV6574_g02804 [Synchytrium endobioticum]TPX52399.1 hypothetical protein SeMB42_g01440 [Synchytrium endobioticum]